MNTIRITVIAILLLVACPFTSLAASYEEGKSAYLLGNYAKAQQEWESLAVRGDVNAQFGMGTLYASGKGVEKDYSKANYWFEKAATQGFPPAQFNLGNAYRHGRGVERDETAAVKWWSLAAQQNFAPAQYNLATAYYFGRGVEQSEALAIQWYEQASANQYQPATQQLELIRSIQAAAANAEKPVPATNIPQDRLEQAAGTDETSIESGVTHADESVQQQDITSEQTKLTQESESAKQQEENATALVEQPGTSDMVPLQNTAHPVDQDKKPEVIVESTVSVSPELLCTDHQWIRLQSPNHYTIQLLGVHKELYVKLFMEKYRHLENLVCVQSKRAGKKWYSIIYDSYPTLADAKAAMASLPKQLQDKGVWIRNIDEVQRSIDP